MATSAVHSVVAIVVVVVVVPIDHHGAVRHRPLPCGEPGVELGLGLGGGVGEGLARLRGESLPSARDDPQQQRLPQLRLLGPQRALGSKNGGTTTSEGAASKRSALVAAADVAIAWVAMVFGLTVLIGSNVVTFLL